MKWPGRNAFFQILMYGMQIYVFLCYQNIMASALHFSVY